MEGENYLRIKRFSLFYRYYMFIDTKEHLADRMFIQRGIRVYFQKEYMKDNCDYVIMFCKVSKRREDQFIRILSEIQGKALLMGNRDYIEFCRKLKQSMTELKEKE